MKNLTNKHQAKLKKALALVLEAQKLIEVVNYESQLFANGDNTNGLLNNINRCACTLNGNVNDFNY